jgi:hypothetical protein
VSEGRPHTRASREQTKASKSNARPAATRRGRPPGSVSLTREQWDTIVSYVRVGVFAHVAAVAAGVGVRTFQEWMARGESRHPTRPCTPKLKAFAREVRQAQAQARVVAETKVYRDRPAQWLKYAARTGPEEPGWTEPKNSIADGHGGDRLLAHLTDEELDAEIKRLDGIFGDDQ